MIPDGPISNMEVDAALLSMMENITIRDGRSYEVIQTPSGSFHVAVDGDRNKPALVTLHEIGLNSGTTFDAFFHHRSAKVLKSAFCIYGINVPGQHADCMEEVEIPSMHDISKTLKTVLEDLHIDRCVSVGYGAGAYISTRFANEHPEMVSAQILVNAITDGSTSRDYDAINRTCIELERRGLTERVEETLFRYFCGNLDLSAHHKLVTAFDNKFQQQNPVNLSNYLTKFVARETLSLNFKAPVLAIYGAESPNANQSERNLKGLPHAHALAIPNCRLPLFETPDHVAKEMITFLRSMCLL